MSFTMLSRLAFFGLACATVSACGQSQSTTEASARVVTSQTTVAAPEAETPNPTTTAVEPAALVVGEEGDDTTIPDTTGIWLTPQEVEQHAYLAVQDLQRITEETPAMADMALPTVGSATFSGPSNLKVSSIDGTNDPVPQFLMLGTADVTVEFDDGIFSGRIQDMFAVKTDSTLSDVTGSLRIQDGVISSNANQLEAVVNGSVTAYDTDYTFEIAVGGIVYGADSAADAISLIGVGSVNNASDLVAEIFIVGDEDAAENGAFANR